MSEPAPETATNRFGLGARPGEIEAARPDPRGWLGRQIGPLRFGAGLPGSSEVLGLIGAHRMAGGKDPRKAAAVAAAGRQLTLDTLGAAIRSETPFAARLLDFFSNHFSVSAVNLPMRGLAATLEREAIAPHLGARFEDMLLAVERHPAMLLYLNNERSTGPGSRVGQRRGRGLNENLAREILELHTLGVHGGYTQADVRELAMAITGWSVGEVRRGEPPGFLFRAEAHEPGARTLLGRRYADDGEAQGQQMLRELARHPATAAHLAFKLARHVVADEPPPALVDALRARWLETGGDLSAVLRTLVRHPDAWQAPARKLKTPREFVVSAMRATQIPPPRGQRLIEDLAALGQKPFNAGSPAGFGDEASAWDGAEALMSRIDWAGQLGERLRRGEPLAIAREALGAGLDARTAAAIRGAESRGQGLALLLMSPGFQRR